MSNLKYYNSDDEFVDDKFVELCEKGKIEEAKQLYRYHYLFDDTTMTKAFKKSCECGQFETAKWLFNCHNIDMENISYADLSCFKCTYQTEYFGLAIDMCRFGGISMYDVDGDIFSNACYRRCIGMAKWLFRTANINIYANIGEFNGGQTFFNCCKNSHVKIAKWLFSLKITNNDNIDDHNKDINYDLILHNLEHKKSDLILFMCEYFLKGTEYDKLDNRYKYDVINAYCKKNCMSKALKKMFNQGYFSDETMNIIYWNSCDIKDYKTAKLMFRNCNLLNETSWNSKIIYIETKTEQYLLNIKTQIKMINQMLIKSNSNLNNLNLDGKKIIFR